MQHRSLAIVKQGFKQVVLHGTGFTVLLLRLQLNCKYLKMSNIIFSNILLNQNTLVEISVHTILYLIFIILIKMVGFEFMTIRSIKL